MGSKTIYNFKCDRCGTELNLQMMQERPESWASIYVHLGDSKHITGERLLCNDCYPEIMDAIAKRK